MSHVVNAGIRLYRQKSDDAKILSILQDPVTFENLKTLEQTSPEDILHDYIWDTTNVATYVYHDKDTIVGFVTAFKQNPFLLPEDRDKHIGMIGHIAVISAYRKAGVGRQLLIHAIEVLKKAGCKRAALYSYKTNRSAHQFFLNNGFNLISSDQVDHPLLKTLPNQLYAFELLFDESN